MSGKRSRLARTKPADDWWRSLASDRVRRPQSPPRSATEQLSKRHRHGRIYHRWQAKAARDSQTWELLLAKVFRARGAYRPATEREAIFRSECAAGPTYITHPP